MKYFLGFVFVISLYACQTNNQENQSNQQQLIAAGDSTSLEVESRNTYSIENESSDTQIAYNEFLLFDSLEKNILPEDFFEEADIQQQLPTMAFPTHIDTAFMEQLANLEWLILSRDIDISEEIEKIEIKYHQIPEIADFHVYTNTDGANDPNLIFKIDKKANDSSNYYAIQYQIHDTWMQPLSSCMLLNRKTFKLSYTQVLEKMNYSNMERYTDTVVTHEIFAQKIVEDAKIPVWEKYWWEVSSKTKEIPTIHHQFYILKKNHIYFKKKEYEGDCPDC
ncbi:MAG: hypothetical protein OHK0038_18780 [Flammeovirgaceae bacterium]